MCLAVPGKVERFETLEELPVAVVDFSGVKKQIHMLYTPEAQVGDYVLVHAGIALRVLNEDHAQSIFSQYEGSDREP